MRLVHLLLSGEHVSVATFRRHGSLFQRGNDALVTEVFKIFIDGIGQTPIHFTIPKYQEKNSEGKARLLFQCPGKVGFFGFEFDEGQEIAAFVFEALALDELLTKVPYPFIQHSRGNFVSRAI